MRELDNKNSEITEIYCGSYKQNINFSPGFLYTYLTVLSVDALKFCVFGVNVVNWLCGDLCFHGACYCFHAS